MTTIKLTEEEVLELNKLTFIDVNQEWKFKSPFYYKTKCGYLEVYSKDEYKAEMERIEKESKLNKIIK